MRKDLKLASAVLAAFVFVGCDSKKDETTTATPPAAPQSNTVNDQVKNATANVQNAATNAQTQANTAAANASDTAQAKLKQVGDYIAQKKFDLADSTLKEVEGMKSSLPQSVQTEVTTLRTELDAAKATGGGMSMPSMPK